MSTLFEAVRSAVTAEEAARVYGLSFGRNGRALCPWHADTHPDLAFYKSGERCYCHACHNGGDAIALTAQIFGITPLEAARRLNADFRLNAAERHAPAPAAPTYGQKLKALNEWRNKRYSKTCAIEAAARRCLNAAPQDWDSPDFREALKVMGIAQDELNLLHALPTDDLAAWTGGAPQCKP